MENIVVGSKECPIRKIWSILIKGYKIKKKWSEFAMLLNVSSEDTAKFLGDQLLNKASINDTLMEILNDWVRRQGNNAKLAELIRVVEDECEDTYVGDKLRVAHNLPWKNFQTSTTWATLPPIFQEKVEQNIPQLLPNISMETVKCKASGQILLDLMTGKEPKLFNSIILPRPTFYLNRTVLPRHIISEKVFDEDAPDIFLFTGLNEFELGRVVKKHVTSTSGKQLDSSEIYARFMVSEQRNHFKEICKKTTVPIHLISYDSSLKKHKWMQTRGSVKTLQRFLVDCQNPLTEKQFLESMESKNFNPVLISDSPGMGKSFFLSKIAFELDKAGRIVIFTSFSDFTKQVEANLGHDKIIIDGIKATLQNLVCNNELSISEFDGVLSSSNIKIDLLMDGFDEVSIGHFSFAKEILKTISASFKSIRLWVTTRLHHLKQLEEEFNVLGYNIKGFDDDDQVNFLKTHWQHSELARDSDGLNAEKLMDYASNILQKIKSQLNKDDTDIAGIPLQCLLIAEVFEEECIGFASGSNDLTSDPKIRINSISDLYKGMVTKKLQKYISTHVITEFAGTNDIIDAHVNLSLKLLFPEYNHALDFIQISIEDLLNIGIVQQFISTGSTEFIHRTFAEYFVAGYVTEKLLSQPEIENDEFASFFLDEILMRKNYFLQILPDMKGISSYKFLHHEICYFVNLRISYAFKSLNQPRYSIEKALETDTKTEIYHACVNNSFLQIFKLILNNDYSDINETIILLVIRNSSCEFFKTIMACLAERIESFGEQNLSNFLRVAVQRSDLEIIEFLIKAKVFDFRQFIENVNAFTKLLLHDCVSSTKYKPEDDIKRRASVIKLLVEINPQLLEERDCFERTPLLCEYAHVDLLKELVRLGADIYSQDEMGDTVLHLSKDQTRRLNAIEYHSLLTTISQSKLNQLLNITGQDENIPLIRLLFFIDPTEETLRILLSNGSVSLQAAFKVAIENGRNRFTLKSLINLGVNILWTGKYGEGYLHVAAHNGNLDALNILVEDNKADVNVKDDRLRTPMDFLIASKIGSRKGNKRFETAIALYKFGGRMGEKFRSQQEKILHQAIKDGNSETVRIIRGITEIEAGNSLNSDVYADLKQIQEIYVEDEKFKSLVRNFEPRNNLFRDSKGNSILHLAVERGDEQAVKELVGNGADLEDRNLFGEVPLHRACFCKDASVGLRIIKLLIDNGANVDAKNKGTFTFLHELTRQNYLNPSQFHDMTEYLFRKKLQHLFSVSAGEEGCPLQRACASLEIEEETLASIHQKGISFNHLDDEGDNVLTYAISGCRSQDFISLLINKCNADWTFRDSIGNTALHIAAEQGHLEAMDLFMNIGLETNQVNDYRDTPLHRIAQFGEKNILEAAKKLVEGGVDVNKKDQNGKTALQLALKRRSVNITFDSIIRKEFARIVGGGTLLELQAGDIESELPVATEDVQLPSINFGDGGEPAYKCLHNAVLEIDDIEACIDMIKSLIATGADPYAKDEDGLTFLHKFLLEKEISPLRFQQFVEYLCSNGLVELLRIPDDEKKVTILHLSVSHIQPTRETLQLFKSHEINLNTLDSNRNSILAYAIFGKRSPSFLALLIDEFEVNWRYLNKVKQNLLHIAAQQGNEDALRFFVDRGLDINLPDCNGHTPIFRVRCNQDEKGFTLCQLLLELGADITQKTNSGENLLHISAGFGPAKVVQLFLEFGFDANEQDNLGRTPLHFVAYRQDDKTSNEIVKFLIENGAVPNAIDDKGCTPLDYAVRHEFQSLSLITCLIDNGADFDNSFLHYSAKYGRSQILKLFLGKKVLNVNAVNIDGDTPLHCALQQKESDYVLEKVQMLLEYGASVDTRNKLGQTPLNILDERDEWNEKVKDKLKFLLKMALAIMLWKKYKHGS